MRPVGTRTQRTLGYGAVLRGGIWWGVRQAGEGGGEHFKVVEWENVLETFVFVAAVFRASEKEMGQKIVKHFCIFLGSRFSPEWMAAISRWWGRSKARVSLLWLL